MASKDQTFEKMTWSVWIIGASPGFTQKTAPRHILQPANEPVTPRKGAFLQEPFLYKHRNDAAKTCYSEGCLLHCSHPLELLDTFECSSFTIKLLNLFIS